MPPSSVLKPNNSSGLGTSDVVKIIALNKKNAEPVHIAHSYLSWTACYDNYCYVHISDKQGSG